MRRNLADKRFSDLSQRLETAQLRQESLPVEPANNVRRHHLGAANAHVRLHEHDAQRPWQSRICLIPCATACCARIRAEHGRRTARQSIATLRVVASSAALQHRASSMVASSGTRVIELFVVKLHE
jgi:hypothetical protein